MTSCQANPLNQFVAKGDQHPRFGPRYAQEETSHDVQSSKAENMFLYGQESAMGNRFAVSAAPMGLMNCQRQPQQPQQLQQMQQMQQMQPVQHSLPEHSRKNAPSWLSQFHSMRIEDPMEFSSDYKNMYASYERPTPTMRFPVAGNCRRNYNFIPRDVQDVFTPEFEALEKELEESESALLPHFDSEQQEFQKIANEIVESCSSSSKLSSSKFMGLVKGIGRGSVTLNKQDSDQLATELHSPLTGERIGNEYFPVRDNTLHSG